MTHPKNLGPFGKCWPLREKTEISLAASSHDLSKYGPRNLQKTNNHDDENGHVASCSANSQLDPRPREDDKCAGSRLATQNSRLTEFENEKKHAWPVAERCSAGTKLFRPTDLDTMAYDL